ncbi:MAG: class I SAM-dependent methyltransferase [Ktedonobacteraceae bacterium]
MTGKKKANWTWVGELGRLQAVLDMQLKDRKTLKALDAGCGYRSYIRLPENAEVVGIDISEEELLKNNTAPEKIVGDIQTYEFPSSDFDVIVCWWVLEHLPYPEKALDNFLRSLKEDGIIILAVPNVLSIKGLLTKYTPYWLHVWYHRFLHGEKNFSPFPTFLRLTISPWALRNFAVRNNLSIIYSSLYETEGFGKVIDVGIGAIRQIINVLFLGKIDVGLTEYILVLKKQKNRIANSTVKPTRELEEQLYG